MQLSPLNTFQLSKYGTLCVEISVCRPKSAQPYQIKDIDASMDFLNIFTNYKLDYRLETARKKMFC